MGSFSIWHWLILLIIALMVFVPFGKILSRTGHSPLWAILLIIPIVNWVVIWVFAFKKWPIDKY